MGLSDGTLQSAPMLSRSDIAPVGQCRLPTDKTSAETRWLVEEEPRRGDSFHLHLHFFYLGTLILCYIHRHLFPSLTHPWLITLFSFGSINIHELMMSSDSQYLALTSFSTKSNQQTSALSRLICSISRGGTSQMVIFHH